MAVTKGEKALRGTKRSTKVTNYTSGAAAAPASGCLAIYVDVASGDAHRAVEVSTKLQTLFDRARESNYLKPTNTTVYFRVPINGSKEDIAYTTNRLLIVEGDVAIGINASLRSGAHGSIQFDVCFKQMWEEMTEQGLETDPVPVVVTNEEETIYEGATLVLTRDILEVADGVSYPDELVITVTSGPTNGQVELLDDPGTAVTEFTQWTIDEGNVGFVHNGTVSSAAGCGFSVFNGMRLLSGQTFAIDVDSAPITNETGTVGEGLTLVITTFMLEVDDGVTDPEDVVFTVTSGPANGQLELVSDPGVEITTFTQAQVNDNDVCYVHDSSETTTGDFVFSVTCEEFTLTARTFDIIVTPD